VRSVFPVSQVGKAGQLSEVQVSTVIASQVPPTPPGLRLEDIPVLRFVLCRLGRKLVSKLSGIKVQ
jgi:hypothetical protein